MESDFPMFDGHTHFTGAFLDQVVASYDECGVVGGINLWSVHARGYAEFLSECRRRGLDKRFVQFYWPDWRYFACEPTAFVTRLCQDMQRYDKLGARGLKVWKDLGMFNQNADYSPSVMDDERLEPVWRTAAELKWWIAVHQADPGARFEARSRTKLSREELWRRRDKVIAAHPELRFILCHTCNDVEDYDKCAQVLDRFANCNADLRWPMLASVPDDPVKGLAFLEKYADRLYLGPDSATPVERPPDRAWHLNECYRPLKAKVAAYGMSRQTFKKITLSNGQRDFQIAL